MRGTGMADKAYAKLGKANIRVKPPKGRGPKFSDVKKHETRATKASARGN
jgi:hypothetical protein